MARQSSASPNGRPPGPKSQNNNFIFTEPPPEKWNRRIPRVPKMRKQRPPELLRPKGPCAAKAGVSTHLCAPWAALHGVSGPSAVHRPLRPPAVGERPPGGIRNTAGGSSHAPNPEPRLPRPAPAGLLVLSGLWPLPRRPRPIALRGHVRSLEATPQMKCGVKTKRPQCPRSSAGHAAPRLWGLLKGREVVKIKALPIKAQEEGPEGVRRGNDAQGPGGSKTLYMGLGPRCRGDTAGDEGGAGQRHAEGALQPMRGTLPRMRDATERDPPWPRLWGGATPKRPPDRPQRSTRFIAPGHVASHPRTPTNAPGIALMCPPRGGSTDTGLQEYRKRLLGEGHVDCHRVPGLLGAHAGEPQPGTPCSPRGGGAATTGPDATPPPQLSVITWGGRGGGMAMAPSPLSFKTRGGGGWVVSHTQGPGPAAPPPPPRALSMHVVWLGLGLGCMGHGGCRGTVRQAIPLVWGTARQHNACARPPGPPRVGTAGADAVPRGVTHVRHNAPPPPLPHARCKSPALERREGQRHVLGTWRVPPSFLPPFPPSQACDFTFCTTRMASTPGGGGRAQPCAAGGGELAQCLGI